MGKKQRKSDEVDDAEAAQRRDEVIKRMLNTPPKPHEPLKAKKKPPNKTPKSQKPKK